MANARKPGFAQGLVLTLPITAVVFGMSPLMATVPQLLVHYGAFADGANLLQLALITPMVFVLLVAPLAGWVVDKLGRRVPIIVSFLCYGLAGITPLFFTDIHTLIISRALMGVSEAFILVIGSVLVCDYYRGRAREQWFAAQTFVTNTVSIAGYWIGVKLVELFGWQGPFYAAAHGFVLALLFAAFIWEPADDSHQLADSERCEQYRRIPIQRMLGIGCLAAIGSMFFFTSITQNPFALAELGVRDEATLGKYVMLAGLGVPLGMVIYWFITRIGVGWLLVTSFLLIGSGFAWMGSTTQPGNYVLASNLQQVGCGLLLPTMIIWAMEDLHFSVRGRALGLFHATFALGPFMCVGFVSLLGGIVGNIFPLFTMMSILCFGAACFAMFAAMFLMDRDPLPQR
jgi:MFS family permease